MDNYFKQGGNLETPEQNYFSQGGDLKTPEQSYFSQGGDLETPEQNYFSQGGDLKTPEQSYSNQRGNLELITDEEIKDYLITIVSGKRYNYENNLNGGKIIVPFDKLKEMVDMGCNIINAQYINKNMIEIEFEYSQEETMGKGRH